MINTNHKNEERVAEGRPEKTEGGLIESYPDDRPACLVCKDPTEDEREVCEPCEPGELAFLLSMVEG